MSNLLSLNRSPAASDVIESHSGAIPRSVFLGKRVDGELLVAQSVLQPEVANVALSVVGSALLLAWAYRLAGKFHT